MMMNKMKDAQYDIRDTKFLKDINYPIDLKKLNLMDLRVLSDELREFLIDTISKIGGHLGASLGVCELTLALHYVYNTPSDKLIWDVEKNQKIKAKKQGQIKKKKTKKRLRK